MVVSGRRQRLVALGQQDEVAAITDEEDVHVLADHLRVDAPPAEDRPVEIVDLLTEHVGERSARERELHVVQPDLCRAHASVLVVRPPSTQLTDATYREGCASTRW